MKIKVEFHTHTNFDPIDAVSYSAYDLIDEAVRQGFQALSFTCHDALEWSSSLEDYARGAGILLIPGVEATIEGKHVLIYGLDRYVRLGRLEDLRMLRQSSPHVFTIAPHPFFRYFTCLGKKLLDFPDCFDAIEYSYFYTAQFNLNRKAAEAARKLNKPLVGTSDVHFFKQLGKTYSLLDVTEFSYAGVLSAIRAGQVECVSQPLSWTEWVLNAIQMAMLGTKGPAPVGLTKSMTAGGTQSPRRDASIVRSNAKGTWRS